MTKLTRGELLVLSDRLLEAMGGLASHLAHLEVLKIATKRAMDKHAELAQEVDDIQREMSTPWRTEDD